MNPRGKAVLWALLPALLLTPPLLWLGNRFENQLAYEERTRTRHTLELEAGAVQRSFDRMVRKLDSLAVFVADQTASGKEVDGGQFNTFAAGLHASSGWIRAFQIVSNGVIAHTYPLQGNEAVLGYNLLADPRPVLGGDVIRALKTGRVTITGPIELVQGGLGIIMRQPLPRTEGTPTRLAAVVLNIAPLLAESGISESKTNGVQLAIRSGGTNVFFGSPEVFNNRAVIRRIVLPDGAWEMGCCPAEGWQVSMSRAVWLFYLAGVTIILLFCSLFFVLACSRANLSETVQQRTEALRSELVARQKAEEQMRQNFFLLQAVTEGTSDAVFVKDRRGCYQMINSAGARFLGRTPEQIIGKTDLDLFTAGTAQAIMEGDRKVIDSGQVHTLEERGTAAGVTRIYQATKAPWRNDHGKIIGVVGVSRDITERKETERALRQSEEQFRLIMENLADLVAVLDLDGHRLYNSPSYARILGSPAGLIGTSSFDQVHPEDRARVRQAFQETVHNGIGQRLQYRLVDQEGQSRHIESQGSVIRDERGQVSKVLVVSRDVTERQRTEETLRESETRHRFLFEQNPMPMLIYERGTLQMLAVNEAFTHHYGYTREEALSLHLTDLYPEEEKAKIAELIPQLRGHSYVGEWHHRKRDGTFITIVVSSHDLAYKGRDARVAVMTDISERKRAEEELQAARDNLEQRVRKRTAELAVAKERAEEADRLKSAFLATMSHELRTPLNSIIGFTGIILQELAGPLNREQTKQLGMVQSSARHLLALINDVLDISKIEAGQLEIRAEPFDLRAALEKVAALVRPMAEKKGLALRVELPLASEPITSDRLRVEQVLLNLLNNAVKFTEHGEIALVGEIVADGRLRKSGAPQPAVRLRVSDTGIGIKPDDLAKLFQPFRQIDSGLTRQHEGTGLGLAICRRLANLMGGGISVQSTWGKGSTFTVVLPLKNKNEP